MEVYLITIFILFAFSLHELISYNEKMKKLFLFFSFLLMVIVVGLRWETGTDWDSYLNTFENSEDLWSVFLDRTNMEKGYLFLNLIIRLITDNYSFLLVILAVLMYYFLIRTFQKLTEYPQLTLLLFFSSTLGSMGSNRQLLAVSICLFALTFLLEGKKLPFIGLVAASFTFHTSSLLFSVYFFFNRKIKSLFLYLAVGVAFVIGKTQLPYMLFSMFGGINEFASDKTSQYLDSAKETLQSFELSVSGLIKRLIFLFIFIFLRDKISAKLPHYNLILNGYVMGTVLYFLFSNTLLVMVSRGSIYFSIMEPILLTSILYILRRDIDKLLYIFLMMAFGLLLMYQNISPYPDLFDPYKGLFINTNFHRFMY